MFLTHFGNIYSNKNLIHGENILSANNFKDFNDLLTKSIEGDIDLDLISKNSKELFESKYDFNKVADDILKELNIF